MIMELKPALLEENGLTEALNLHCDLFARRQNVTVNLDIAEHLPLAPEQEVAVYRIVQEALGNVQKHSDADWASVSLRAMNSGETVNLVVRDNGKGFDPGQPGYGNGLMNMRARCREAGGELTVESAPGEGTTIRASFPALGEK
jgi:signal transduction histidine kinase